MPPRPLDAKKRPYGPRTGAKIKTGITTCC